MSDDAVEYDAEIHRGNCPLYDELTTLRARITELEGALNDVTIFAEDCLLVGVEASNTTAIQNARATLAYGK